MMLSRLFLNALNREVQRCLGDAHELHARVLSMFPKSPGGAARATFGVLHRLEVSEREGTITLLVQSTDPPDFGALPDAFLDPRAGGDAASTTSLDRLVATLVPGATLRFRLRANPTRKIQTKTLEDGKRRHGKRVPVRAHSSTSQPVSHDAARIAWLRRKLEIAGLRIVGDDQDPLVRQRPDGIVHARKHGAAAYEAHVFEGVVEVMDANRVRAAVAAGIGPAKAYGFGLLSLGPG